MKETVEKFIKIWKSFNEPIVEAVELMPDEKFTFKPANALDIKSFHELVLHIPSAQKWFMNGIATSDWEKSSGLKAEDYTSKAPMVNLLKTTIQETEKKIRALTEKELMSVIDSPFGRISRMDVLWFMQKHEVYHSGQVMTFLRLAGIKPPMFRKK